MAKAIEKNPKVELSKEEQKALAELEIAEKEVKASMKGREAETVVNEKLVETQRKALKVKDETDPIKRRALLRGNKE